MGLSEEQTPVAEGTGLSEEQTPAAEGTGLSEEQIPEAECQMWTRVAHTGTPVGSPTIDLGLPEGHRWWPALVDTGAAVSLMRPEVAALCQGAWRTSAGSLRDVSGNNMEVQGAITTQLRWGSGQGPLLTGEFLVVPRIQEQIILGADMLRAVNATLSMGTDRMAISQGGLKQVLVLQWDQPVATIRAVQEEVMITPDPVARSLHRRLSDTQRAELQSVLLNHAQLFGTVHGRRLAMVTPMHIDTGSAHPVHIRGRRLSPGEKDTILKELQELRSLELVEPSVSPWVSPALIVPKKDGTKRFCVDFRGLNKVTVRDRYPLPLIDEVIDRFHGMQFFSKMDLRSGFWQVPLDARDAQKSAFTTPAGLFQWRVMPMGLANSPAVFQRAMDEVLGDLLHQRVGNSGVAVYIDDVVVFSGSWDMHMTLLSRVFQRLEARRWRLKISKCEFGADQIEYLGYTVSTQGLHPSGDKVAAVRDAPTPTNWSQVASFLGLVGYYRRFVRNFAAIAEPLHRLGKKDCTWHWGTEQERSFQTLKGILIAAPVLRFPDFNQQFIVQTDASYAGMGAVLSQLDADAHDYAVAYASRALRGAERHYSATDLEGAAVVWAVKLFRPYLHGRHFQLMTDHSALKALMGKRDLEGRLMRYALCLQEYDFDIVYRPGPNNANADALSRLPASSEIAAVSLQLDPRQAQQEDGELRAFIEHLRDGKPLPLAVQRRWAAEGQRLKWHDNALYYVDGELGSQRWRLVVPMAIVAELLHQYHDAPHAGHLGSSKMLAKLQDRYYWPGMAKHVHKYCQTCIACQGRKRKTGDGPRQHAVPIPAMPFDLVTVDIVGPFPATSTGLAYIVVFHDYLSRWVEAFALPDQKAETVCKVLCDEVICRYGVPRRILSDNGPNFVALLTRRVYEVFGIHPQFASAYHPQTNGLAERFNSTLQQMLSCLVANRPTDWARLLPYVLFAYRTAVQASTQLSPFKVLFGREPVLPADVAHLLPPREQDRIDWSADERRALQELENKLSTFWQLAKEHLERVQSTYDQGARMATPVFSNGDRVWVRLRTPRALGLKKVAPRWGGPFLVVEVVPPGDTFRIRPVDQPSHPLLVLHVSRLKRCYSREMGVGLGAPYTIVDGDVDMSEVLDDEVEVASNGAAMTVAAGVGDEEVDVEQNAESAVPAALDSLQGLARTWTLQDVGDDFDE